MTQQSTGSWQRYFMGLGVEIPVIQAVELLLQAGQTAGAQAILQENGMSNAEAATLIDFAANAVQTQGTGQGVSGQFNTGLPENDGPFTPLLNNLLTGDLDFSNLPPSEFRSITDAGIRALMETQNISGLSPFLRNQRLNAATDAAPLFGLATALGRFGQPNIQDEQINLGDRGVQERAREFALQNIGGPLTTGSFRDFFDAARGGIDAASQGDVTDPDTAGQAAAIMAALGITASDSASNAYAGVLNNFVQPRVNLLPTGIRNIFNAGFGADAQAFLGGRSSAEISPSQFLNRLQQRGILF